jgi:hypothetical protein
MTVVAPPRFNRSIAVVVAVGSVVVAAIVALEQSDAPLSTTTHTAAVERATVEEPRASTTAHEPTPDEIAAAAEFWQRDVEVAEGRDVVRIHYEYRPAADLNFPQAITMRWSRCRSSDGLHHDGDDDESIATGSLDPKRWDVADFIESPVGDRNRNGVPDVAIRTDVIANGFSRERIHLFEARGDRLVDVLDVPWLGEARWPVRFDDVDHDHVDELVTIDRTWDAMTTDDGAQDDAAYNHDARPRAEFVVEFERGGRMVEAAQSPHVERQRVELEQELRQATRSRRHAQTAASVAADDDVMVGEEDVDVRLLTTAGSLLLLDLDRPAHDVDDAVRRFRARVAALHVDSVHSADLAWIERHAVAVDVERLRPPD